MEKPKKKCTIEQERQKMAIKVGGGLGGVVVWGGALAIATLVSVSAIKLRKRSRSTNNTLPPPQPPPPPPPPPPLVSTNLHSHDLELNDNKDQGSEGLRALVQHPIHHHTSSDGGATDMGITQIDSTPLIFAESLILNNSQKENSTYGSDQRILYSSDDPKPESRGLTIDHDDVKILEFSSSISSHTLDSLLKPEKEYTENMPVVSEVIKVTSDEKAIEAPIGNADQIEEEEDSPQLQSIGEDQEKEEEEKEYGDGENMVEEGVKIQTALVDQIAVEEDPRVQLNHEEEEEEDNEEDTVDKGITVETAPADQIAVEEYTQAQLNQEEEDNNGDEDTEEKGVAVETAQADQIAVEEDTQAQLNQEEEDNNKDEATEEKCVAVETAQADQIAVEEHPPAQLSEEEEGEEEEEDNDEDEREEEEHIVEKPPTIETAQVDQIAVQQEPQPQLNQEGEKEDNEEDIVEKGVTVETAWADQIAVEDDSQSQLSEEEENNDEDSVDDEEEEDIVKRGEESSEGTEDSSMESNAEAIWPTESMKKLSHEFRKVKIDNHKLAEKIEEEDTTFKTEVGCLNKNEISEIYDDNHEEIVKSTTASIKRDQSEMLSLITQTTNSPNLRIWIWSMVVLLLLLGLVAPLLISLTQMVELFPLN